MKVEENEIGADKGIQIRIRKALFKDIKVIEELDNKEFEPRVLEKYFYPFDPTKTEEKEIFLAEINGKQVAKIELITGKREDLKGKIGLIRKMIVKKEFRKKGIAKKLVEFVVGKCRKKECIAIDLHVVESNEAARKLYEKFGFTERHKEVHYRKKLT